jgi:hypothetical protein
MKTGLTQFASSPGAGVLPPARVVFRARFQRALRNCVRRRFSVAECFGVIWLETLEEVALTEEEQAELYDELIGWAKHSLFPEVIHAYSPNLFTDKRASFSGEPDGAIQASPGRRRGQRALLGRAVRATPS